MPSSSMLCINAFYGSRLRAFANRCDPKNHIYSIDLMPSDGMWGKPITLDNKSGVLCAPGTNDPYVVWIIGRVSRCWFFNNAGEPQRHVSINVVPWTVGTTARIRSRLAWLSMPVQCRFYIHRSDRLLSHRGKQHQSRMALWTSGHRSS